MEKFNQGYRDSLAAKLKSERSSGNNDKAEKVLSEQQDTILYKDAKEDHYEDAKIIRIESVDRKIAELEALKQRILESNVDKTENKDELTSKKMSELEGLAKEGFQTMRKTNHEDPQYDKIKNEWLSAKQKVMDLEDRLIKAGISLEDDEPVKGKAKEEIKENQSENNPVNDEVNNENIKRSTELKNIIISAQKSLDWMKNKNAPWSTESMIIREEMKIKHAEAELKKIDSSKNKENTDKNETKNEEKIMPIAVLTNIEEKKTIDNQPENELKEENKKEKITPAPALIYLEEQKQKNKEKYPVAAAWIKRNWKRVVIGGALIAALFFLPKGCDFDKGSEKKSPEKEIIIEKPEIVKENICESVKIEKGDGDTQLIKKALIANKELKKVAGFENKEITPELFKKIGQKINVIDEDGNEIRLKENLIGQNAEISFDKEKGFTITILDNNGNELIKRDSDKKGINKEHEYASTNKGKTISWKDALNIFNKNK